MKAIIYTLLSILLFANCSYNTSKKTNSSCDTIRPKIISKNSPCFEKVESYYKKYGFLISDYYTEIDFFVDDIDNDKLIDTVSIFSPKDLLPGSLCKHSINEINDRVLVVKSGTGNNYKFSNIITNKKGLGTVGAELIKKSKNGFVLHKHLGQNCFFDYSIEIKHFKSEFFIRQIKAKIGGCEGQDNDSVILNYPQQSFRLKDFKREIIDSIRSSLSQIKEK